MKYSFYFVLLFSFTNCSRQESKRSKTDFSSPVQFLNNNEIRYYEKTYLKKFGKCFGEKDCATVDILYPELLSGGNGVEAINKFLFKQILSLPFNKNEYCSFDEISDSLFSEYIDVKSNFPDYHTPWFIKSKTEIYSVTKNIISFKNETTIFTGGANAYNNISFTNFSLLTGNIITLDSLTTPSGFLKLNEIGEKYFAIKENFHSEKSYNDLGYWFENNKFKLNNNFAITDSGLIFLYNLYEIAPRSCGVTELFIPKAELKLLTNIFEEMN